MGRAKRIRPKRLGEKLLAVRRFFDCSLADMAEKLSTDEFILRRTDISKYELDTNEPPLPILLEYSRVSNIPVETLIDDNLDLPSRFL